MATPHEADEAFLKLKVLISSAFILQYFSPKLPAVVSADASGYGLGGVLLQEHEGILETIASGSQTLSEALRLNRKGVSCQYVKVRDIQSVYVWTSILYL